MLGDNSILDNTSEAKDSAEESQVYDQFSTAVLQVFMTEDDFSLNITKEEFVEKLGEDNYIGEILEYEYSEDENAAIVIIEDGENLYSYIVYEEDGTVERNY